MQCGSKGPSVGHTSVPENKEVYATLNFSVGHTTVPENKEVYATLYFSVGHTRVRVRVRVRVTTVPENTMLRKLLYSGF